MPRRSCPYEGLRAKLYTRGRWRSLVGAPASVVCCIRLDEELNLKLLTMAIFAAGSMLAGSAGAFSLDVREVHGYFERSTEARSRIPFLDGSEPIHERLTDQTLECGKQASLCERLQKIGVQAADIREGVRSNDFPAQYLNSQAVPWCKNRVLRISRDGDVACILGSFVRASENRAKFSNQSWANARPFGMRGHFGDLQFLHSMAPEGQQAGATYAGVLMWMEFSYRASRSEFDLRSDAYAVPVAGMNGYFVKGARKVGDLFNYRFTKEQVQGIALGQMLHIAQDSFAGCHTERNKDGTVIGFFSYAQQKTSEHAKYDKDADKTQAALSGPLNPVMFGKELLELRVANKEWYEVKPLIERYFRPVDDSVRAVAGAHCM